MREVRARDLVNGRPDADRVLLYSIWFRDHNNPRYAELLPRLDRLDACLVRMPRQRVARAAAYRAFQRARRPSHRTLLRLASRRYRSLLALDFDQLSAWPGAAVMDADDPFFTAREVAMLNAPATRAYVVTAAEAGRRYESLGVEKPWVVIPQGVDTSVVTDALRSTALSRKHGGELVVGWIAAHLLTDADRGAENALYNVEHLLALWDDIHAEVPEARLWLVGGAGASLRERVASRPDIELLGRLPRAEALAAASCFDIAVYARTEDQGVRAAKVSEFLGLGVPTVSYDYEVTANLREAGAGILVRDAREFVSAVVQLLRVPETRARLASAALAAGRELDWAHLARRYARDVLDAYLPAG